MFGSSKSAGGAAQKRCRFNRIRVQISGQIYSVDLATLRHVFIGTDEPDELNNPIVFSQWYVLPVQISNINNFNEFLTVHFQKNR